MKIKLLLVVALLVSAQVAAAPFTAAQKRQYLIGVKAGVQAMQKSLPIKVDDETTVRKVLYNNGVITYYNTINIGEWGEEYLKSPELAGVIKPEMQKLITDNICSLEVVADAGRAGVIYVYKIYLDVDSSPDEYPYLMDVMVDPVRDCNARQGKPVKRWGA